MFYAVPGGEYSDDHPGVTGHHAAEDIASGQGQNTEILLEGICILWL